MNITESAGNLSDVKTVKVLRDEKLSFYLRLQICTLTCADVLSVCSSPGAF